MAVGECHAVGAIGGEGGTVVAPEEQPSFKENQVAPPFNVRVCCTATGSRPASLASRMQMLAGQERLYAFTLYHLVFVGVP